MEDVEKQAKASIGPQAWQAIEPKSRSLTLGHGPFAKPRLFG